MLSSTCFQVESLRHVFIVYSFLRMRMTAVSKTKGGDFSLRGKFNKNIALKDKSDLPEASASPEGPELSFWSLRVNCDDISARSFTEAPK